MKLFVVEENVLYNIIKWKSIGSIREKDLRHGEKVRFSSEKKVILDDSWIYEEYFIKNYSMSKHAWQISKGHTREFQNYDFFPIFFNCGQNFDVL